MIKIQSNSLQIPIYLVPLDLYSEIKLIAEISIVIPVTGTR